MEPISAAERTKRVMEAMGFTEEDLAQNRQGMVTARQQEYLQQFVTAAVDRPSLISPRAAVVRGAVIVLGIIVLSIVANGGAAAISLNPNTLLIVGGTVVFMVLFFGIIARADASSKRRALEDLNHEYTVKRYHGTVDVGHARRSEKFNLIIQNTMMFTPQPVIQAFLDGQKYACYAVWIGNFPYLISAEGLD